MLQIILAARANPSTLTTALIAAGGALAGALVGGGLTSFTQFRIDQRGRNQAKDAERQRAVIAARLKIDDLLYAWNDASSSMQAATWITDPRGSVLQDEDRRALYGALEPVSWQALLASTDLVDNFYVRAGLQTSNNKKPRRMTREDAVGVLAVLEAAAFGIKQCRAVSGDPETHQEEETQKLRKARRVAEQDPAVGYWDPRDSAFRDEGDAPDGLEDNG